MELVGEASDATQALEMYRRVLPDVVLMDMVMPEHGGAEAITLIRQEFPSAVIIGLTTYEDEKHVIAALKAGARGFLYKSVSVEELAEAIRQVHSGRMILDPKAADVMQRIASESPHPAIDPVKQDLSEREKEVLVLIVDGLTNKQIALKLDIKPSTVKQYTGNIFSKLGVSNRTEAASAALRMGLLESDP